MLSDFCGRSNGSSSHLNAHVQERFIVNRSRDGIESPRVTVSNVRGQGDGTEFGSEDVLNKPVPSINQQSAKLVGYPLPFTNYIFYLDKHMQIYAYIHSHADA